LFACITLCEGINCEVVSECICLAQASIVSQWLHEFHVGFPLQVLQLHFKETCVSAETRTLSCGCVFGCRNLFVACPLSQNV